MKDITWKAAKFTLLPGIIPRTRRVFFSGFDYVAFFAAQAYAGLRLLPASHPYLDPANFGRYGLRHVLAEARRRLVFDRYHLDQVVLHYTLMGGFFLMFAQLGMMLAGLTVQGAFAGEPINVTLGRYFVTVNNATDIAYNLLDRIFGFPGIYNSNAIALANPFHDALHLFFNFYNVGILVVGVIVFIYLATTIVAEMAETGTPFGRRFNRAWVPLRLVWAIALLCPLTWGMNGGQLATMYVAKWGSSAATNGWLLFLNNLADDTPLGPRESLVAVPRAPTVNNLVEFMNVARTCSHYEFLKNNRQVGGYIVNGENASLILPYNMAAASDPLLTFEEARTFMGNRDIRIRFGEQSPSYTDMQAQIEPICGEMTFQVVDLTQPGAQTVQSGYFILLGRMWSEPLDSQTAYNQALRYVPTSQRNPNAPVPSDGTDPNVYVGDAFYYFRAFPAFYLNEGRLNQINNGNWARTFNEMGWGGAALWYNKLTEMNGAFITATHSIPRAEKYPRVMEYVAQQKAQTDQVISPMDRYRPYKADGNLVDFANPDDRYAAIAYYEAQQFWRAAYIPSQSNAILDTLKAIFGVDSLFSTRENIAAGINPLVQLVSIGRGLVESALNNLGYSFGAGIAGGLAGIFGNVPLNSIGKGFASFGVQIAMIAFSLGFMLSYVVPFMPFLYFIFSMATWLKSIFMALVGIPLWALAHIRIDGEGLPGPGGLNGYYLLFEVFMRPLLTVIGLIGGLVVFAAEAFILNEVWDLVTSNLTGFQYAGAPAATGDQGTTTGSAVGSMAGLRGLLDQFMFLIFYVICVYMMSLSSFKLADSLPDNILRWMGARTTTFGIFDPNPAEGVMGRIAYGMELVTTDKGPLPGLAGRNK